MTQVELERKFQEIQQQLFRVDQQLNRTRQLATAQQAESFLRAKGKSPRMPIEFTSQFGEDLVAWTLLEHQTTGFFIEAGAFDGYRYSATYAFEGIGWDGLLVEAIPERARQCSTRRPNSRVVNAALGADDGVGEADFWVVDDAYGGMYSYSKETPQQLQALGQAKRRKITVPRATLNSLLADHHGEIDLAVLDLEGAEVDALGGFDLRRFRPRVLFIEENTAGKDPALRNLMQQFSDYKRVGRLAVNEIFIRADQNAVFEELRWLLLP